MDRSTLKKRKKKRSILKKIVLMFISMLIIIGSYFGFVAYKAYDAASSSFNQLERGSKSKLRAKEITVMEDPFSVLLMGIETYSSGGKGGRADSLIVATINPRTKSIKLLSIPRDSLVMVPNKGSNDKINHSYNYGGKESTIETVETLLNIPIDYYATVNFKGFKQIIDEIGGVDVNVPFDFWEKSDVGGKKLYFYEGPMHLNGDEALAYARMRKQDPRGDFGRNDRQKEIIEASVKEMVSVKNLLSLDDIAQHVGNNIETNLKISEALGVQKAFIGFDTSNIEKLALKGTDAYYDNVYYFELDEIELENIKEQLQGHLNHTN
ncbi:LCP family protein [Mesobacillus selenatarsenatis]|uniref:Cell envelope-associated transcriptional attenuator LytR-CpsA-Psr, subfamily F2 (As in PMID19099556) n=1 Tax=Mesobacillus selenatarsenatis (strain DSM 18680 / JCM 14380 / FERM P-15431 / SF-1) TaxID=1321606 RepID=A0A0A8WZ32_MESS1|nr:LCP family protein [Mesobacillus selenatarsenatis]GAM12007.1 cell envelope-associated transcriptional attenuator LytR-CpsA-Psr, subfamily F2 (as in PMID19099556) [Mesobacillus selenatarsenatis SF-1]